MEEARAFRVGTWINVHVDPRMPPNAALICPAMSYEEILAAVWRNPELATMVVAIRLV